jgi:anti-sigma regulatory factor (Ser/Thr protein kinase)
MTGNSSSDTRRSGSTFVHAAMIVDSDDSLRARLIPTLRRSLNNHEPVLMVVGSHTERLVRAELGKLSSELQWDEPAAFYQRLGFAFEAVRRYLAEQQASGRRVHIVTQPDITTGVDPANAVDRATAYLSYESVCNQAYAGYGCPVTCIWDSRHHPTLVIEGVRSVHTHEISDAGTTVNERHIPPADYLAAHNDVPLEAPPADTDLDLALTDSGQLGLLRTAVWSWATEHSFATSVADDVIVAVAEVAANGLVHGAAPVRVRAWQYRDSLNIQVDDPGGRPLPPTAGYLPPDTRPGTGRGLWLARQFADVVTAHTGAGRTSVRLRFPYDITHRNRAA